MRRLLVGAAVAATVALGAAAPAVAQSVETVVQDDALFLHGSDEQVTDAMGRVRALGFDRVRLTAGWSVIAPQAHGPERPDFDPTDPEAYPDDAWLHLDRAVRAAVAADLKPMIDIAFWAPRWATAETEPSERHRTNPDPEQFALFAAAVARRYSGTHVAEAPAPPPAAPEPEPTPEPSLLDGLLGERAEPDPEAPAVEPVEQPLPAVDLYTLWNEPNHRGFLWPQWGRVEGEWVAVSADHYRAMVHAAYPAVKRAAPGARVLIGATAAMESSTPNKAGVPPLRFLRRLACVDERLRPESTGACGSFRAVPGDGWSHHPYSLQTEPDAVPIDADKAPVGATGRLTRTLRRLVAAGRLAPRNADVYMTEYGYETRPHDPRAPFGAGEQARLLAWAEAIATADPAVRMWPQFQLHDRPEHPDLGVRRWSDWQSGLFDAQGRPKPAVRDWPRPVHARCVRARGRRVVEVWGRLRRPATAPVAAVEAVRAGRSRPVASAARRSRRARRAATVSVRPPAGEAVRRYVRWRRGTSYRLRWSVGGARSVSAAVAPVGCPG